MCTEDEVETRARTRTDIFVTMTQNSSGNIQFKNWGVLNLYGIDLVEFQDCLYSGFSLFAPGK